MATSADILWFKTHFAERIRQAVRGTVFDVDMLTALACQETGELWGAMRRNPGLTADQIVALCCGDTLDADRGRRAFPQTKAELVAAPNGQQMFDIARAALLAMANQIPAYQFARNKPNKFCHGFGVFQYDLQFFPANPRYFLDKRYEIFENTLNHALDELKTGLKTLRLQNRSSISDLEFCHVAICYNTGGFDPRRGLRQGHSDNGKFYGEFIRDYLAMARTVAAPDQQPVVTPPAPGTAPVAPGGTVTATGPLFRVDTTVATLRLRSQPRISSPEEANVIGNLADGLVVRSVSGAPVSGFIEVETMLGGRVFRGFASARFLVPAEPVAEPVREAAPSPALPAAHLTPSAGTITKRTAIANALSLNEAGRPGRQAPDPAGLRDDLAAIIDYLSPEKLAHKRYQPRDGLTFCNIYAHDYCHLAGVYLPRVWWTQPALIRLARGEALAAKIGATVDEMRANDLFRWLHDFGGSFGWRRAASTTELQDHANLGGVSLIVARRREDGRSGHIVAVVPETATETARRDATGQVDMPLQSQAGVVNFNYGRSTMTWWKDARFAESAFWLHA